MSRSRHAYTTGRQGRWAEAEASFREILHARRRARMVGDDHPFTLATRRALDERPA